MTLLEELFYDFVIIAWVYEALHLFIPGFMRERREDFRDIVCKAHVKKQAEKLGIPAPKPDSDDLEIPYQTESSGLQWIVTFAGIIAAFTCIIGLFSSQAPLFALYLLVSLIASKIYLKGCTNLWFYRLDGLICVSILTAVLLNKFIYHYTIIGLWRSF